MAKKAKPKKVTLKECIELAEFLFQMENESIGNDKKEHWTFNEWFEKFGEKSIEFEPQLTSTKKDHEELGKMIKEDADNGFWKRNEEGELYNYQMINEYGGFIVNKFEQQLADLTGIGTQTVLELV